MTSSVLCTRPIRVLEAAYRLSGTDEEWLSGLVHAVSDDLDRGQGVLAYLSRLEGPRIIITSPLVARGVDDAVLTQIRSGQPPPEVTEFIRARMTIFGGVHQTFGSESRPASTLRRMRMFDTLAAITQGDDAHVLQVVAQSVGQVKVRSRTVAAWSKVLLHVGTALRLRQRLGAREALLTPKGSIADATAAAKSPSARQALIDAVVRTERARSRRMRAEPEAALSLWQGLISGRWSLVDHFEADGRRYIAAHENVPGVRDPRALGPFERACVHYAMHKTRTADIAYALGASVDSVTSALARAATRLGLASSSMFVRLDSVDVERLRVAVGSETLDVAVLPKAIHPDWQRRLSAAELAVAELVTLGLSDSEIAEHRGRSPRTVSNQLRMLYRRLGIEKRAELLEVLALAPR